MRDSLMPLAPIVAALLAMTVGSSSALSATTATSAYSDQTNRAGLVNAGLTQTTGPTAAVVTSLATSLDTSLATPQTSIRPPAASSARPSARLVSPASIHRLQAAIVAYSRFTESLPQVATGPAIEPGQHDARVPRLRERLSVTGLSANFSSNPNPNSSAELADSSESAESNQPVSPPIQFEHTGPRHRGGFDAPDRYDANLVSRVQEFQRSHGLPADGRVTAATVSALNVSPAVRLTQLRLNLARHQQLLQQVSTADYVLVNIPGFELHAVRNNRVELVSTVIVGREDRKTPVMQASISAVNFHPAWHVPASIIEADLYPRIDSDPDYFKRKGFRIFRAGHLHTELTVQQVRSRQLRANQLALVQQPGPTNALGRVRIAMPNRHSVFLHDTPVSQLFGWHQHLLSAGCVRVARIVELAHWLLSGDKPSDRMGEPASSIDQVSAVLRENNSQTLSLADEVPVHLVYLTAWVDRDGVVQFRDDVYQRDVPTLGARQKQL